MIQRKYILLGVARHQLWLFRSNSGTYRGGYETEEELESRERPIKERKNALARTYLKVARGMIHNNDT